VHHIKTVTDVTAAYTLDRIAEHSRDIQGVWASAVQAGDWIIVRTKNSTYSLAALGDGRFQVSGGWFATRGEEFAPVRVIGCTWGGRAILTDLIAAPGMFIEFSNGVHTTRIRDVRVLRGGVATTVH